MKNALKLCLFGAWILLMSRAPADPDLWGHVRFGQDLLASGTLTSLDPYSFTSDHSWINHEWLSELLMAVAFNAFGVMGLNVLRCAVVGAVLWLAWRRSATVATGHRLTLVALAALGITLRAFPVRPQLFSLLCFAAMLAVVTRAEEEQNDRLLACVPPIFALWVNLHGGWIVGLGMLALWTAACLVHRPRARWWPLAATLVTAGLATLVNPYGPGMWTFIYSTVGLSRPLISDWLPLYAVPPAFWLGWIVAAGLCLAAMRRRSRVPRPYLVATLLVGLAAIRVSRLDAFFCLSAVFLLPAVFPMAHRKEPGGMAFFFIGRTEAVAVVAVAIVAVFQLQTLSIRETLMPETEAVAYVIEHRLRGRFLTWFDWGEFAIWHLADHAVQVSMDGRRETVYSDGVVDDHLRFYFAGAGASDYPKRIGADYVWLPLHVPAVSRLESEGWSVAFKGPVSVILRPPNQTASAAPFIVRTTSPRPFPGP